MVIFLSTVAGVWFSLSGTTYQNNSLVTVDNIGQDNNSLLCITDQPTCCQPSHTENVTWPAIGNWYFPNGTKVPDSGTQWDFHGTRGHMMVQMQRRGGLEDGIYRCEIPDTMNVTQIIYIGVYSASTGEWHIYTYICVTVYTCNKREGQHVKVFGTCMECPPYL